MKKGLNLTELAAKLEQQQATKRDFVADTRMVTMRHDAQTIAFGNEAMPVKPFAHKQLAQKLKIPVPFYERAREQYPMELSNMVNAMFEKEHSENMIRTLDGEVRAIVSNKFRALDNYELAEAVLPVLMEKGVTVESADITETKMYLKATLPALNRELPMPEGLVMGEGHNIFPRKVTAALTISNSEVGAGSLSVSPGIFELQCTNLATFKDQSYRTTHVGRKHEVGDAIEELLSDETRRMADAVVWAKLRDLTMAAFEGETFDKFCEAMITARGDVIEKPAPAVVEVVASKYGLNEKEKGGFLNHLVNSGELTRYGLQWAATRLSQDVEDYDRASELERLGGQLIELPRNDWTVLAKAA